jgi:maltooligosyltrehalose trehalohydrolase
MVFCLQNHDQIGNRPFGRRLNHQIEPALFRALSALLLFVPETPLLFMGQEWAASTRFLYFTDHHADLGRLVTMGRRAEFARFEAFADPVTRTHIPDPQAASTFVESRLVWDERTQPTHEGVLELHRALLKLRRTEPALQRRERFEVAALDDATLAIVRGSERDVLLLVLCTEAPRRVDVRQRHAVPPDRTWQLVLTTEDPRFVEARDVGLMTDVAIDLQDGPSFSFNRPASVVLRGV